MIKFESIDLNLLRVFEALYSEGHVTRAARRVGISQPAASNALARLRRIVDDPLFERRGRRMAPTARARSLSGPVARALSELRGAMGAPPIFDPAVSVRAFSIASKDWIETAWLPDTARRLAKEAPGVTLQVRRLAFQFVPPAAELAAGELDLAVGQFPEEPPQTGVLVKTLADERFVGIVRSGHPKVGGRLTLRLFLQIPQIRVVASGANSPGYIDRVLAKRGLARRTALAVPHFLTIPEIVRRSDLLGVVPARILRGPAAHGLRLLRLPVDLGFPPIRLAWHESGAHDPARAWLRSLVESAFRPGGGGSPI